jgi:hypothetical protein
MSGVGTYNFKKITDLLKKLANKHRQINSYSIGDITQLGYYTEERLKENNTEDNLATHYPLMYVIPNPMTNDGRQSIYQFNILIMDILNTKNFDVETDIWSDTLDICKDIVSALKYTMEECYEDFDITMPVIYTPFSEKYDDYLSGWNIDIKIMIPDALNFCDAPFEDLGSCIDNN